MAAMVPTVPGASGDRIFRMTGTDPSIVIPTVMIGQGNKFEIWDEEHWNEQRESWLSMEPGTGPVPVEMESLSL